LIKEASSRPTYAQLLEHPFLKNEKEKDVDMSGWVAGALEKRAQRGVIPLQSVEA
jgi:mitogen-activated protein kinase kinase